MHRHSVSVHPVVDIAMVLFFTVPTVALVRGWRYLGSRRCRDECHDEWRRKGRLFAVADVSLLLLMMGLEVALMMVLLIVGLEI